MDFDRLLSHHDQRLASQLNSVYIKEERNFVEDTILTKNSDFLDPTVISSEYRIAEVLFHHDLKLQLLLVEQNCAFV